MKIAWITNFVPDYRISLFNKLSKIHDIDLFVLNGFNDSDDNKLRKSNEPKLYKSLEINNLKFSLLGFDIRIQTQIFKHLSILKPDLIVFPAMPGNISHWLLFLYCKKNKIKIIGWFCGWMKPLNNIKSTIKKFFSKSYFNNFDWIVSYSSYGLKILEKEYKIKNCSIIYNGIENDVRKDKKIFLKRSKEYQDKYGHNSNFKFLFVGALTKEKKVEDLIKSYLNLKKRISNITLLIVGDGPEKKNLSKYFSKNDIYYCGSQGFYEVNSYYIFADCFVLPGLGGLALNQSLLWGTPVISSLADGTAVDLVYDGTTGYLLNQSSELESKMEKIFLLKKEKINKISKNCAELIQKRSNVNNMVKEFDKVFKKLK